jgi:hypothetical protein
MELESVGATQPDRMRTTGAAKQNSGSSYDASTGGNTPRRPSIV